MFQLTHARGVRPGSGDDRKTMCGFNSRTRGACDYNGGGYQHISQKMSSDGSQLDPGHQAMLKDGRIAKTLAHGTYYRDIYNGQDAVAVVGANDNGLVILGHRQGGGLYVITAYVDAKGDKISAIKKNGLQKGFRLENEKTGNGFPSPELEDVCPGLC